MSSAIFSLPNIFNSYVSWVSKNPQTASEYETVAKWVSYIIAGRISNSQAASELIYCVSNLLALFNDQVIRKRQQLETVTSGDQLKLWLTVIEYSEVFCELSAEKLWGKRGKWLLIVSIQVFKCVARLLLIYQHRGGTIQNPPIPLLNRKALAKENSRSEVAAGFSEGSQAVIKAETFTLRSGRVVRKVESSPPINARNWKPPQVVEVKNDDSKKEESLEGKLLLAETIYVVKPLAHLTSMAVFGEKSWKPYLISLAMDLISLRMYKYNERSGLKKLSEKQRIQLSRRTVALVFYVIRSPFYEKQSKDKIEAFLESLSKNMPLARLICNPFLQYLPFWQSNYFYMWST